jgi:hypothetical protein
MGCCCLYNRKLAVVASCGLVTIPGSIHTFDRRLKTMSTTDIKERISAMGYLFVVAAEGLVVDLSITKIDRAL